MTKYSAEQTSWQAGRSGPDEESFRHLFDRYYQPIVHFFARRGLPADECRDLAQETFLRAHRSLPRFRGDSTMETWLFTIAVNIWKNALRSRQARRRSAPEIPLDEVYAADSSLEDDDEGQTPGASVDEGKRPRPSTAQGPLSELLAEERFRLLREALNDLPAQMRRCVVLRTNGFKYREVAAVMGISINTVKSQLYQAAQRLRVELADQFTDIEM